MMRGRVVLVQFPFDDLSSSKVRPVVCLTNPIGVHRHIIMALITSRIPSDLLETDIVLDTTHPDCMISGLSKPSTLRLDHVITLRRSMIIRQLGRLSIATQTIIVEKLYKALTDS
jgi:mRNA interferase MazF